MLEQGAADPAPLVGGVNAEGRDPGLLRLQPLQEERHLPRQGQHKPDHAAVLHRDR